MIILYCGKAAEIKYWRRKIKKMKLRIYVSSSAVCASFSVPPDLYLSCYTSSSGQWSDAGPSQFSDEEVRCYTHLSYDRRISALILIACGRAVITRQRSVIDGNSRGWYQCERFYRERRLVRNIHMSWAAADVSDWLLQLALALYKHRSRRSVIHQLLSALF